MEYGQARAARRGSWKNVIGTAYLSISGSITGLPNTRMGIFAGDVLPARKRQTTAQITDSRRDVITVSVKWG